MICGLSWLGKKSLHPLDTADVSWFHKGCMQCLSRGGRGFEIAPGCWVRTVTRGGAYGKAGGQNHSSPSVVCMNTQKGNLETQRRSFR